MYLASPAQGGLPLDLGLHSGGLPEAGDIGATLLGMVWWVGGNGG